MARYLDPKNDLPFKKIFGEHKDLLISFLNALLPLQKGQEIAGIEYLPPEQVPRTPLLGKNSVVDVRCKDSFGRQFIVEMQMEWSQAFANRLVFNGAKAYVQQFDKKDVEDAVADYIYVCPVYSLAIVARNIPALGRTAREKWYHHYKITDVENREWMIEGLEFIAVELPKFRPETWSQTDKRMAVLWLRFLKEVSGSEGVPEELLQEKEIKQAISICEVGAYTREELAHYDKYLDAARWEASRGTLECNLAAAREALAEKEDVIAEQGSVIAEKEGVIAEKEGVIAEQNSVIVEKESVIAEKEGVIAEQNSVIVEKESVIAEQGSVIAEQGSVIAEQKSAFAEQSAEMKKLRERIAQLERKP